MKLKQFGLLAATLMASTFLSASGEWEQAGADVDDSFISADNITLTAKRLKISKLNTLGNIANQGVASAQSTFPGYSPTKINDGNIDTTVGGEHSWSNGHTYTPDGRLPQWIQLAYSSERQFAKVVLYTSKNYELKDYDIQVRSGRNWITVARQRGNKSVKRIHSFSPTIGTAIRVMAYRGPDNQSIYTRVNELQVFEKAENLALKATATAQSTFSGYSPSHVNDGSKNTKVGGKDSWSNGHKYTPDGRLPQWLQLDFKQVKTLSKVVLYTSLGYEIKDYDIQVWSNNAWVTVIRQRNNTHVFRTHSFAPVKASKLRVIGLRGPDRQTIYVRINELEVY